MIEGVYLDGKTSRRAQAYLEVLCQPTASVKIHVSHDNSDHEKINLSYSDLKIETRLANTPREISFGAEQLFVTEDNDAIDKLIKQCSDSKHPHLLHKLESNLPLIFLATMATIAIIWSVISHGIPKSAEYIAHRLPDFASEQLGSNLSILDKTLFEPSQLEASRQQHILDIAEPYLLAHRDLNPKLVFRSGMQANALALPDGHMIFTDDFVNLIDRDDELLAVLFHEIGHLKHKHMLRRALQDSMITLLVIFVTGDVDSVDIITGLPTLILDLSYSRKFERQADQFALQALHQAKLDVGAFARAMQRLEDYYREDKKQSDKTAGQNNNEADSKLKTLVHFLSTHPATEDRVEMVAKFKKLHNANE